MLLLLLEFWIIRFELRFRLKILQNFLENFLAEALFYLSFFCWMLKQYVLFSFITFQIFSSFYSFNLLLMIRLVRYQSLFLFHSHLLLPLRLKFFLILLILLFISLHRFYLLLLALHPKGSLVTLQFIHYNQPWNQIKQL